MSSINPDCEGCCKCVAVMLCVDGMWRCSDCCLDDGYNIYTGEDVDDDEDDEFWGWNEHDEEDV